MDFSGVSMAATLSVHRRRWLEEALEMQEEPDCCVLLCLLTRG
jgi:hypothetical protein